MIKERVGDLCVQYAERVVCRLEVVSYLGAAASAGAAYVSRNPSYLIGTAVGMPMGIVSTVSRQELEAPRSDFVASGSTEAGVDY